MSTFHILHIGLALLILASYAAIPFTDLRCLPVPQVVRVSFLVFLLASAINHLIITVGRQPQPWNLIVDLIQFVAGIVFLATLSKMVSVVMQRRARLAELEAEVALLTGEGDAQDGRS